MKNALYLLVLFFSFSVFAQTTESFRSAKMGGNRDIRVKLPASYEKNTEKKYPLILVLDSEFLFDPFAGNLSYANYWDDVPEVILVGVNQNKNNEREDDSDTDPKTGLPGGKGAAFFEFIGTELLPYLETKYRVAPFKVIAGLDLTAGFLNTYLYKDAPIFQGYISFSPELYTNMETRIPQRLAAAKEPIFYYHATAEGDLKKMRTRINALNENMKAVKNELVNYKFEEFKGGSHYSIPTNGIPSALYQFFEVYRPISSIEYQEKIAPLKEGFVVYLNKKYEMIEKALGIKMNVRINDFIAIETAIIKNEAWNEYEELAQISGQQYEKTMLYDYHMGNYWEKRKEIKRAIKCYQDGFTKQEIAGLTKDMMMNKAEDLKALLPKKEKLKGGKAKDVVTEEAPVEETPATDTPVEETPTEEKKPE